MSRKTVTTTVCNKCGTSETNDLKVQNSWGTVQIKMNRGGGLLAEGDLCSDCVTQGTRELADTWSSEHEDERCESGFDIAMIECAKIDCSCHTNDLYSPRPIGAPSEGSLHGTAWAYNNLDCRCRKCLDWYKSQGERIDPDMLTN